MEHSSAHLNPLTSSCEPGPVLGMSLKIGSHGGGASHLSTRPQAVLSLVQLDKGSCRGKKERAPESCRQASGQTSFSLTLCFHNQLGLGKNGSLLPNSVTLHCINKPKLTVSSGPGSHFPQGRKGFCPIPLQRSSICWDQVGMAPAINTQGELLGQERTATGLGES